MYESHWGLKKPAFRACLDPESFYPSATHEEALARLDFLAGDHRRLGLLMGDSGSGKSLLLEVFAAECRRQGRAVAKTSLLGLEPVEMLRDLSIELGRPSDPAESVASLWQTLTDQILANRYQRIETVLLLDDADRASRTTQAVVARLVQFDTSPEARLTVVLAARRQRISQLDHDLLELAHLRIDVEVWDKADTESYLQQTLDRAGCPKPVFDSQAVSRLHELTQGVPRKINQLADLVLLAGAGQQLDRIDTDVVESVYHELAVVEV